jgi:hypothetical protein
VRTIEKFYKNSSIRKKVYKGKKLEPAPNEAFRRKDNREREKGERENEKKDHSGAPNFCNYLIYKNIKKYYLRSRR